MRRPLRAPAAIITLVEALPGVSGVSDDLPYGKPELIMQLTPRGSSLGFSIDEVGKQIRNAFEGSVPRRFARGDDEVAIAGHTMYQFGMRRKWSPAQF